MPCDSNQKWMASLTQNDREWDRKKEEPVVPLPSFPIERSGLFLEHVLAYAAERADEIIRQIRKRNARCEIVIRIALCLVVNPATDRANPNFHQKSLLLTFDSIH